MTPLITGTKIPSAGALASLQSILEALDIQSCRVTSVARTPRRQAEVMYDNCMQDLPEQKRTYKEAGQAVIAVFENAKILPRDQVIAKMLDKINEVGPENVSHHCLPDDAPIVVIDIAKNSIPDGKRIAFWNACKDSKAVSKILDENGVFHVEVFKEVPAAPAVQTT